MNTDVDVFKPGDRVMVYTTDDVVAYHYHSSKNPYEFKGTINRKESNYIYWVRIDSTSSQDSEGRDICLKYHEKQIRKLNTYNEVP